MILFKLYAARSKNIAETRKRQRSLLQIYFVKATRCVNYFWKYGSLQLIVTVKSNVLLCGYRVGPTKVSKNDFVYSVSWNRAIPFTGWMSYRRKSRLSCSFIYLSVLVRACFCVIFWFLGACFV